MMKRRTGLAVVLLLVVVTCIGYGGSKMAAGMMLPWQKPERTFFRIGYLSLEGKKNFLQLARKEDLEKKQLFLELIPFVSARAMESALLQGRITGQVGDFVQAAKLTEQGMPVTAVGVYTKDQGRMGIVAAPNSVFRKMGDLRGIPIALDHDTIAEYAFNKIMDRYAIAQIERKEVLIRPLHLRLEMLLDGKVKAALLPEPFLSEALSRGAVFLAETEKTESASPSLLMFRQDFLKEKEEAVKRLLVQYDLQIPNQQESDLILQWLKARGMVESEMVLKTIIDEQYLKKKKIFPFFS